MKALFATHLLHSAAHKFGYESKGTRKGFVLVKPCHTTCKYLQATVEAIREREFIHHFQIFQDSMGERSPKAVQGGSGSGKSFFDIVSDCVLSSVSGCNAFVTNSTLKEDTSLSG